MGESIKWTMTGLAAIQPPASGRKVYHDPKCSNLTLTVTSKGTKTFARYGRVHGKPERIRIGTFPEWTIENARLKCQALSGDIARGVNPMDQVRSQRSAKTLRDAWEWYLERYAKKHKRSWGKDVSRWENHLATRGHIPLRSITRDMIVEWHQSIGSNAPQQANLVLSQLQAIFQHAVLNKWMDSSPIVKIKRFKAVKHERYLSADELPAFFKTLDDLLPGPKAFVLLCLMTGARRSNICAMEWAEIDFEQRLWTVPADKSKNRQTLHIALSDDAITVLESRRNNGSPWVFPSSHSKSGHMTEVKKFWAKLIKAAGIQHIRIHDLRHTVGTWAANRGVSLQIIGKSLAQMSLSATQRYAHVMQDPARESLETTFRDIKAASEKES